MGFNSALKVLNLLRTDKLEEPCIDLKIILKYILNLIKSVLVVK